ncbi:type II toxin-antitoxin system RelE/ParE family toxin [Patescibacteria group bacterium]
MAHLLLSKTAEKEFSRLSPKDKKKIIKRLELLKAEPKSGKKLSGKLRKYFSLRVWPYRIIYETKSVKVIVHHISHRQQVYK